MAAQPGPSLTTDPAADRSAVSAAGPDPAVPPADDDTVADGDVPEPHDNESGSVGSSAEFSNFSVELSVDLDDDGRIHSASDSATGASPSSVSVSSSVYKFVTENGRTFHKYKEGKYYLPNDEKEQHRLDLQHAISRWLLKGKLGLAPVQNPKRVLDVGTGTGIWAVEFAEENPDSEVLGTDLSPIQPDYLPPNCRFEIDDVEDEWVFHHKFDYIHGRYLLLFLKDWNHVFKSFYKNLHPGGWAEFQEIIICFQSIDGSIEGTALQRWNTLLLEGIRKMGRRPTEALRCKKWMAEAGFVNISEKKFAVPMNPWAKGKVQKALGAMQMANNLEGVDGLTMTVFTRSLGWTPAQVEEMLVDVKRDMKDRSIHAYITVVVAWGQKPYE
ncbi:S-adenosyl-L-methionine-dependent methyltransferase [Canariomyces notabilis]|uniref:S-adenosyl-L-methionine-dependent methyltransferase n=1 Tax=Canariomyces notabilis TaxID=2074819 RepID=A0AAN6TEL3_9PEZI|nr:S-adenosyl-L-methionine-dependent methyltransferase [Canariomyces arenarius]